MSYPVIAEIWSLFEGTLQIQAKRLVEDIAKHNTADPKALWSRIKPQIKIGLLDVDLPEPTLCSHPAGSADGAIRFRCRAPCVIGFNACPRHVNLPKPASTGNYQMVDRIVDYIGTPYFVDADGIAHDKNGRVKGYVQEDVLVLFDKV
jgi:hypothetical protein